MNTVDLHTYRMRKQIREIYALYKVREYSPVLEAQFKDKLMAWHGEGSMEEAFSAFRYMYKLYI